MPQDRKKFPAPVKVTVGTTRWRLSELCAWEGLAPPEQERYVNAAEVARRYGVSSASIWRWSAVSIKSEVAE